MARVRPLSSTVVLHEGDNVLVLSVDIGSQTSELNARKLRELKGTLPVRFTFCTVAKGDNTKNFYGDEIKNAEPYFLVNTFNKEKYIIDTSRGWSDSDRLAPGTYLHLPVALAVGGKDDDNKILMEKMYNMFMLKEWDELSPEEKDTLNKKHGYRFSGKYDYKNLPDEEKMYHEKKGPPAGINLSVGTLFSAIKTRVDQYLSDNIFKAYDISELKYAKSEGWTVNVVYGAYTRTQIGSRLVAAAFSK